MKSSATETKEVATVESKLYKALCQDLRQQIRSGQVQPGDKLPSMSVLCERYGVSNITVRAAVRELVNEGLLESRPRSGVFVRDSNGRRAGVLENAVAILSTMTDYSLERQQSGWLHHITLGAQSAVRDAGLHAVVLHHDRLQGAELDAFAATDPRVIVLTDRNHAYEYPQVMQLIEALNQRSIHVTLYGASPQWESYDRVVSDHASGAYQEARWLIENGHQCILNLWPLDYSGYWYPARFEGYSRAMTEAGLEVIKPLCIIPDWEDNLESFSHAARQVAGYLVEYLNGPKAANALMVHTDGDYYLVAAACRLFGLKPGEDIFIVGYDNIWRECRGRDWEPSVPQATIDKRNRDIGYELVTLLLQRERSELSPEPQCRVIDPQLVVTSQTLVSQDIPVTLAAGAQFYNGDSLPATIART